MAVPVVPGPVGQVPVQVSGEPVVHGGADEAPRRAGQPGGLVEKRLRAAVVGLVEPVSMTSGTYSASQNRRSRPGSQVKITTGPRATRRTSRRPARRLPHWCTLKVVIAASKALSGNGRASAAAFTAAASPAGRCARIDADGSTGVTWRSAGSYEPAPAPTFSTVRRAQRG